MFGLDALMGLCGDFYRRTFGNEKQMPIPELSEDRLYPKGTRVLVGGLGYGTVRKQLLDGWLAVEFDEWIGTDHGCSGLCYKGYGEWIMPEEVLFGVAIISDKS